MDRNPVIDRRARQQLRLAQGVLLVLLVGTALVGYRIAGWPLMTWTMYTRRMTPRPPQLASAVELRVRTRAGQLVTITPIQLFTMDRISAAEVAFESAFDDSALASRDVHRRYLATVVRRLLHGDAPETIEGWGIEWAVDPFALPPLDRRHPLRELRLGGFPASEPAGTSGSGR